MQRWRLNSVASSFIILLFAMIVIFGEAAAVLSIGMREGWSLDSFGEGWGCRELSKGYCFLAGGKEEFAMDSEAINSRILAESTNNKDKYIGYKALEKDSTLCSVRGAPYSRCRPEAPADPYNRGCSTSTGCYRFSS